MGESLVETPAVEKKMDDSIKSGPRLDVSVSFGRFENDDLSWEKWSSFSPNKYLEEVGSLSTPGSVAQKKAYFEAHYKRIAAKKAVEMEQEKSVNPVIPTQDKLCNENHYENPKKDEPFLENHVADPSDIDTKFGSSYGEIPANQTWDESCSEDHAEDAPRIDAKSGLSDGENIVEENAQTTCTTVLTDITISDESKDDGVASSEEVEQGDFSNGLHHVIASDGKEDVSVAVDCESEINKNELNNKYELNGNVVDSELKARNDSALAKVETPLKDSRAIIEIPSGTRNVMERTSASKKEGSKLNARNMAKKVTPTKKDKNIVGTKKTEVSPAIKPLSASTPRYSKPTSISTPVSSSHSSKKKVIGSPLPQSKNFLVGESKRATPTALHMSFSLGSSNSSPAPMTRKSLIMERMGDKDIVKRAFKTFQNRTIGSFADEKSSTVKQVSSVSSDMKLSTPTRKRNEGLKKDSEKSLTQSSQSATRSKLLSSASPKTSPLDRKSIVATSPSVGLKSDDRAEKRKEFLRKLEAKSIVREAANAQRTEKSKEAKEAEMKKLRQSLNFKAKPLPSFYKGQGKTDLEKETVGNGIHNQPKLNQ